MGDNSLHNDSCYQEKVYADSYVGILKFGTLNETARKIKNKPKF